MIERDPLPRYVAWLEENEVLDDEELDEIRQHVKDEVEQAVEFAEASPRPEPDAFLSNVFVHEYPASTCGRGGSRGAYHVHRRDQSHASRRVARDETTFLIGEDTGIYGGVFKATRGLLERSGRSGSSTARSRSR